MLGALFWRCARYTYGLVIGGMEVTKLRRFMVWRFFFLFLRCAGYIYWYNLGCTQVAKKRGCPFSSVAPGYYRVHRSALPAMQPTSKGIGSRAGTFLDRNLGIRFHTTRDATSFYADRVALRYFFTPEPG